MRKAFSFGVRDGRFEAIDTDNWPVPQSEMPDPGFQGLRADSPGSTVLDGAIGAG